jgi:kinesin family protein C1
MNKEMVRVCARVRPLLPEEIGEEECIRTEPNKVTLSNNYRLKQSNFHQVFDKSCSQQLVFEQSALYLLEDCLRGYSCTLLAVGQNQSGKSFTIEGGDSEETKGVVPRCIDYLGTRLASEGANQKILLRVSYI